MDNYYDHGAGEWVTDWSRYQAVLAEPRFAPIREHTTIDWPPDREWALVLELLAAVPSDAVALVGAGPLDDFVHRRGATFIEPIATELSRNGRLRNAVIEVNLYRGTFPPPTEAQFVVAAGPRFRLLDPPPNER